jgi:hypothetical protein
MVTICDYLAKDQNVVLHQNTYKENIVLIDIQADFGLNDSNFFTL